MTRMLGSEMPERARQEALNAFVYRMTFESVRRWPDATRKMRGFRLPLISDKAWLAHTYFAVTKAGRLARNVNHCSHDHNCRIGPVLPIGDAP